MAKNTVRFRLFLGLTMMCSMSLDAAMISATDEDALVEGVASAVSVSASALLSTGALTVAANQPVS